MNLRESVPELRQRLRVQRSGLSTATRQQAALAVAEVLRQWPAFGAAARIAAYWACGGELDPVPALDDVVAAGRAIYLPVLAEDGSGALHFAPYQAGMPLRRNRFGIPEPDVQPAELLAPAQLDLVLTPLLAFDRTGTRLGMGGGFYDRSFAFLRDPRYRGPRPCLLGVGYAFQQVENLARQPWDVPLSAVVTEQGLTVFNTEEGAHDELLAAEIGTAQL